MQVNYLPPLEPNGDFRSYVCGDVVIDPTAAIASGVLIQADQGSQIIIGASVCIGMGTVIHAQEGILEIRAGANLGAGVLVYGTSKIGEGCCIGASSSIVRSVITKGAIIPSCSLIVDQISDQVEAFIKEDVANHTVANISEISEPKVEIPPDSIAQASLESTEIQISQISSDTSTLVNADSAKAKAYAQSQINRYIKRLFPNN
jgi:carbon dioxide concentrating mechanism protein CcmN